MTYEHPTRAYAKAAAAQALKKSAMAVPSAVGSDIGGTIGKALLGGGAAGLAAGTAKSMVDNRNKNKRLRMRLDARRKMQKRGSVKDMARKGIDRVRAWEGKNPKAAKATQGGLTALGLSGAAAGILGLNKKSEMSTHEFAREAARLGMSPDPMGQYENLKLAAIGGKAFRSIGEVIDEIKKVDFGNLGKDQREKFVEQVTGEYAKQIVKSDVPALRQIGNAFAVASPFLLAGAAVPAGTAVWGKLEERKNFNNMLDRHPDLKKKPRKEVEDAFEVLKAFSPTMSKSPVAAGNFVAKAVEYKAIDPAQIKQLTDIEGSASGRMNNFTDRMLASGIGALQQGLVAGDAK